MHAVDLHASASALLCGDLLHALFVQQIDLHAEDPRELLVSGDVELEQLPDTTKPASLQLAQFWRVWCSPFDNVLGFGCKTASKAELQSVDWLRGLLWTKDFSFSSASSECYLDRGQQYVHGAQDPRSPERDHGNVEEAVDPVKSEASAGGLLGEGRHDSKAEKHDEGKADASAGRGLAAQTLPHLAEHRVLLAIARLVCVVLLKLQDHAAADLERAVLQAHSRHVEHNEDAQERAHPGGDGR